MKHILFFSECGEQDIKNVGRKGVNLSLLFKRGFKVPPGFIVSSSVFEMIKQDKRIKKIISEMYEGKQEAKALLNEHLKKFEFPEEVEDEITEAYLSLSVDLNMNASSLLETKEVFVAVRSSVVDEKNLFRNIMHKTVLNVKTKKKIFKAILENYYSMIVQAHSKHSSLKGIDDLSVAVIIQKMISSKKSGIASSINEETNEKEIVVKACFGLGEGISSGGVFPDVYKVDKKNLVIKNIEVVEKQFEFVKDIDSDETIKHRLGDKSLKQVLDDNEILEISRILKKISSAFEKEIKIEWAIKDKIIYVLQMKDIKIMHKETIEMEIIGEDEKIPEIIDIADVDLEDDLQMLDEIEKFEKDQHEEEKIIPQEKEIVRIQEQSEKEEVPEYNIIQPELFNLSGEKIKKKENEEYIEEESDDDEDNKGFLNLNDKTEVFSEIIENEDETITDDYDDKDIEEESIFENYDSFKVEEESKTRPPLNNFKELAYLNAANTIVFCHMAIKDKLRQSLGRHIREIPEDFEEILFQLKEYEKIGDEQEIKKLDKIKKEFILNKRYPSPEDVSMSLRLLER